MLDEKIRIICHECDADEPPTLYISSSDQAVKMWNRSAPYFGRPELSHEPNFRYLVGKTKPYKGTRHNPKPFHFYNILAYMLANYEVVMSSGGLEADDEVCIAQRTAIDEGRETTICSRDKDLRICAGRHYSWECGKQAAIGPETTDTFGWLDKKANGEVYGYGLIFFLFQMLTGDSADNIPGLPKVGAVGAWNILNKVKDKKEALSLVKKKYKEVLGDQSKDYFLEQGSLLWMVQRRDEPFSIERLLSGNIRSE